MTPSPQVVADIDGQKEVCKAEGAYPAAKQAHVNVEFADEIGLSLTRALPGNMS